MRMSCNGSRSHLDLAVVDLGNDHLGALLVYGAAERQAGSKDLLDCALEGLGHRLLLNDLGDLLDLLESEVALVGHVLDLLSISLVASELLDEEGG